MTARKHDSPKPWLGLQATTARPAPDHRRAASARHPCMCAEAGLWHNVGRAVGKASTGWLQAANPFACVQRLACGGPWTGRCSWHRALGLNFPACRSRACACWPKPRGLATSWRILQGPPPCSLRWGSGTPSELLSVLELPVDRPALAPIPASDRAPGLRLPCLPWQCAAAQRAPHLPEEGPVLCGICPIMGLSRFEASRASSCSSCLPCPTHCTHKLLLHAQA